MKPFESEKQKFFAHHAFAIFLIQSYLLKK